MENLQANELRIGNWVEHNQPKRGYYTTVQKSTFSVNVEKLFKPIPLTKEWLLKFGFCDQNGYLIHLENELPIDLIYKDGVVSLEDSNELVTSTYFLNKIQYVHQLQNLYFALTGEELTINQL
jgi:hypothetical protein